MLESAGVLIGNSEQNRITIIKSETDDIASNDIGCFAVNEVPDVSQCAKMVIARTYDACDVLIE